MKATYIKAFVCAVCVAFLGILGVVGAWADSSEITPALNTSELFSMVEGVEDQFDLQTPLGKQYYPFAVVCTSIADQDFRYYVYASETRVHVESLTPYNTIVISSTAVVYKFDYDMYGKGLNAPETAGLGTDISIIENGVVVMFLPELGGWTYGDHDSIGLQDGVRDFAFLAWRNAMQGYQGVWNGITINEKVDEARKEGYNEGLDLGKEEGYSKAQSYYLGLKPTWEDEAYTKGWNEAMDQYRTTGQTAYWLDVGRIITAYTDGIANLFQAVTNFELFGINVAGVFGAIIATLILGFVVSLLLKLFGLLI